MLSSTAVASRTRIEGRMWLSVTRRGKRPLWRMTVDTCTAMEFVGFWRSHWGTWQSLQFLMFIVSRPTEFMVAFSYGTIADCFA